MAPVGLVARPSVPVELEGTEWRGMRAEEQPLPALTRSSSQLSEAWVVQVGWHEGQGATVPTHDPAYLHVHQPCSEVQAGVESWTSPYSYSHNHKNGSTIHNTTTKLNTYKCGQRLSRNNNKKKWTNGKRSPPIINTPMYLPKPNNQPNMRET